MKLGVMSASSFGERDFDPKVKLLDSIKRTIYEGESRYNNIG